MAVRRVNEIPTENQEQRALVKWLREKPDIADYVIKITNEGRRTPGQGWHLKCMGMCPGASDLFIAVPRGKYHGLWVEMKRAKRYTPSEMKRESWIAEEFFQSRLRVVGFAAYFCYGFDHAKSVVESYLAYSM